MHGTTKKPMTAAERKRAQRAREKLNQRQYKITVSETVLKAHRLQSKDANAKMTDDQADRASRNRKKVAADLAGILEHWAIDYTIKHSES